jgi:hypothetical protein
LASSEAAFAQIDLSSIEGRMEHCDEAVETGAFDATFECGDELFETRFNIADGGGANVGDGGRFTRVPRADQGQFGGWATHTPRRATGPNASACNVCHIDPFDDGAGEAGLNVIRDPEHSAQPSRFIQRNTPHLFAPGALQRLAEEMSADLDRIVDETKDAACSRRRTTTRALNTKGVNFGSVTVRVPSFGRCPQSVSIDEVGIDSDLVVKPFQWKGVFESLREFNRDAAHNELGMQAVEIVGDGVDGDFDGVADEMSIADQTALAVYLAAQPRPVTKIELNQLRASLERLRGGSDVADALDLPQLSAAEIDSINRGEQVFTKIGCAGCHRPALLLADPKFREPSRNRAYRDDPVFPAGQPGLDPDTAIAFDLTRDQPDNVVEVGGVAVAHLGPLQRTSSGQGIVRLFGDLKRHDMGPELAENIDETGHGRSVWLTKELWGAGSTGQYLHDGRATTILEAINFHGGEGAASRSATAALPGQARADLVAFVENLVLFKIED